MGILSRAGDLVYTFRFLKLLTTKFENTNAYALGIIDASGKRTQKKLQTSEEKSSYTPFHRLAFNLKKIIEKAPGGNLASYAAALYLIKEKYNIDIDKVLKETNLSKEQFLEEQSQWFLLENRLLAPGIYRVKTEKLINSTCEGYVKSKDQVRVLNDAYPIGEMLDLDIYEAIHLKTQQKIYVTVGELIK